MEYLGRDRSSNCLVAVIALVLFAVAVVRIPVIEGLQRPFLLAVTKVGVLVVFAAVLFKINKWAMVLLVVAAVSHIKPMFTLVSQRAFVHVLYGLVWYFFIVTFADDNLLMDVMCVIVFVHFLSTFVQYYGIPSVFVGSVSGLTFNPNEASALYALCFPAFLRDGELGFFKVEVKYRHLIPMVLVGLAMVSSFNGWLATGAAAVFYGWMAGHLSGMVLFATIAVALAAISFNLSSLGVRMGLWEDILTTDMVVTLNKKVVYPYRKAWVFGCGLGHWKIIAKQLWEAGLNPGGPGGGWSRLHNTFLNGLVEMGAGFVVFVFGYGVNLIRRYSRKALIPFAAVVVIIVCGSTNSMFRMNALNAMIAITWLSILELQLLNKGAT